MERHNSLRKLLIAYYLNSFSENQTQKLLKYDMLFEN